MGTGIATKFAAVGQRVLVYENHAESAALVPQRCRAILAEMVEGGVLSSAQCHSATALLSSTREMADLSKVDLVIEAVSESIEIKHQLYAGLERHVGEGTLIASSTSGFTPQQLSRHMRRPERLLIAHFWNPPHLVPLVEVVADPATAPAVVEQLMLSLQELDCTPVLLKKAVPGFVGNRLQFAVLREALHLLSEGVADAATIDLVMKQSVGRRYACIGPLEGADIGGLQTFLSIANYLWPELAAGHACGIGILEDLVERGDVGRRSGRGLYVWDETKEQWMRKTRLELLHRVAQEKRAGAPP